MVTKNKARLIAVLFIVVAFLLSLLVVRERANNLISDRRLSGHSGHYIERFDDARASLTRARSAISGCREGIANIRASVGGDAQSVRDVATRLREISKEVKNLEDQLDNLSSHIDAADSALYHKVE